MLYFGCGIHAVDSVPAIYRNELSCPVCDFKVQPSQTFRKVFSQWQDSTLQYKDSNKIDRLGPDISPKDRIDKLQREVIQSHERILELTKQLNQQIKLTEDYRRSNLSYIEQEKKLASMEEQLAAHKVLLIAAIRLTEDEDFLVVSDKQLREADGVSLDYEVVNRTSHVLTVGPTLHAPKQGSPYYSSPGSGKSNTSTFGTHRTSKNTASPPPTQTGASSANMTCGSCLQPLRGVPGPKCAVAFSHIGNMGSIQICFSCGYDLRSTKPAYCGNPVHY